MPGASWREVPVGLDAHRWVTRTGCKTVLAAVHTVASGQRLLEVTRLLESDRRIQVIFTTPPDVFSDGVADFLHELGAVVVSWEQATRTEFDLAVAAAYGSVHELHAPLIVLPHGAGYSKLVSRPAAGGAAVPRRVYGLDTQRLVRDGRVVPSAIVLSHEADLALLRRQCPEALPAAVVAGDPCYDRLLASLPRRAAYRAALGAADAQQVIVVASTWGPRSLFGQYAALLDRMLRELPPGAARVVALLHPNVWSGHGSRQVRAWLAECTGRGMILMPPAADWRGALVAADLIVGDQGSLGVYGTAVGAPVLLAGTARDVDPASAAALLAVAAPRLRADRPLAAQFRRAAASYDHRCYEHVAARITSQPGRFRQNIQCLMYGLLRLAPPPARPETPAELPFLITDRSA
jgi:hypothetical protein